jgi:hypothetical protein
MPPKRTQARGSARIRGSKSRKPAHVAKKSSGKVKANRKSPVKSKAVSHSNKSTRKNIASKAKKNLPKRDSKGRFAPKVKKNVTKERFKKLGLPYRPVKPHSKAKKRTIVKKPLRGKVYTVAPTLLDTEGKPKQFVPNDRSDPFRALPRFNPDTKTTLNPHALLKAIAESLETELNSSVDPHVVETTNGKGYHFHEYRWLFPGYSIPPESMADLFEMVRPYLRPHYRSLVTLIAQVGFEHEDGKQTGLGFRTIMQTFHYDGAFMALPSAMERWERNTSYSAVTGIAIKIKAPDWWQPGDLQKREHAPMPKKMETTKGKVKNDTKRKSNVGGKSKPVKSGAKERVSDDTRKQRVGSVSPSRGKRGTPISGKKGTSVSSRGRKK